MHKLSTKNLLQEVYYYLKDRGYKNVELRLIVLVQQFCQEFLGVSKYKLENVGILQIDSTKANRL